MAKKATPSGEATVTVSEKHDDGTEIVHTPVHEQVVKPKPVALPCVVGVGAGETIPTQKFASVRLDVYLSVTVEPDEVDDAFEMVSTWVGEKLAELKSGIE